MLTLRPCFYKGFNEIMKNKLFIFAIGLVAGLTIGVLFSVAIKELIVQFKELHISLNRINIKQSELSQRLDSIQGKLIPDVKKTVNTPSSANTKLAAQNIKSVSAQKASKPPGSVNAGADNTATDDDSDIVVMTNQLVSTVNIPLRNNDTGMVNRKIEETDSTLAAMSDVPDSKNATSYRVEFWKSPLNYKGYKMSDGKIILYGINPDALPNLVLMDGDYYLLINQTAYMVEYTDDYKPFDKVTDKLILKKLGI